MLLFKERTMSCYIQINNLETNTATIKTILGDNPVIEAVKRHLCLHKCKVILETVNLLMERSNKIPPLRK